MMKDLYTFKINCKGKRTVGKANKGINVGKNTSGLKQLKLQKGEKKKWKKKEKKKLHRIAKAQSRGRGLYQQQKCD